MADVGAQVTTRTDVAILLENFADYVNPSQVWDPWFTIPEINRQFAWDDIPEETLLEWLGDLVLTGTVEEALQEDGRVWRWRL